MTFSLVARCVDTGMFGMVIASSSPAVAARCAYARAGVGAVASQNVTDPRLGPKALDMMEAGRSAPEALARLAARERFMEYRQPWPLVDLRCDWTDACPVEAIATA